MTFTLVVCFGNPAQASTFAAYARTASVEVPAPRGEILICPFAVDVAAPVVVVDSRVGGSPALLVVHSDEPVGGPVEQAAALNPGWQALRPATGLRGDVMGVFLDADTEDLMTIDTWPEWGASRAPLLISMGMLTWLPPLNVEGLPLLPTASVAEVVAGSPAPPSPDEPVEGHVVDLSQWRNNRTN